MSVENEYRKQHITIYGNMIELPSGYKKWVSRVSNVVSFIYPFNWNSEARFNEWLMWLWIPKEEYMNEACDVWTFVHLQIEKNILAKKLDLSDVLFDLHNEEIENWIKYFQNNVLDRCEWTESDAYTEYVVLDEQERYQWTCDLVIIDEKSKTVWLYDWKTWWIAKKRYWLPNKVRKPIDKLKKLSLQLSLYAEYFRKKWYNIWGLYGVWLHKDGAYEYELDLYSSEGIDNILLRYYAKDKYNINLTIEDMKVTLNTPTGLQYEQVLIEKEIKDWEKAVDIIDEMIETKEVFVKKLAQSREW